MLSWSRGLYGCVYVGDPPNPRPESIYVHAYGDTQGKGASPPPLPRENLSFPFGLQFFPPCGHDQAYLPGHAAIILHFCPAVRPLILQFFNLAAGHPPAILF